jgi:hypothetical protein
MERLDPQARVCIVPISGCAALAAAHRSGGPRVTLTERGHTSNFIVSYDDTLTNGPALADAVLARCEPDLAAMSALFGGLMPAPASLPFHINLVPGGGGASHPGCLATTITCFISPSSDTLGVPALVDAEVAEVLMATQGLGFDCGASNGEALSRALPGVLYPSLRYRFSTGNDWLNSTGPSRPDWVSNTEPTDQNFVSIGCGSLFLNYLADQLNFSWHDIIAATAPTLAGTAANLGVNGSVFTRFAGLLARHFPPGTTAHLPDDDPFPLFDGADSGLTGIRYNGTQLLAVGQRGTILTSPDGTTWIARHSGTASTLVDAAWGAGRWVVVGLGSTILTSPDGVSWTARTSGTKDALQGIAWSGTRFVATSASFPRVLTSADGVTWTAQPLGAGNALLGITWDGARFVGVGYNGTIVTSPDGVTWTARSSGTTRNLVAITGGSTLVAAGNDGTILTSSDGAAWTARASGVTDQITDVAWSGTGFVAVSNSGGILTSSDGLTWVTRASGTATRLLAVTWGGSRFVAVGDFVILVSSDGVTWTAVS